MGGPARRDRHPALVAGVGDVVQLGVPRPVIDGHQPAPHQRGDGLAYGLLGVWRCQFVFDGAAVGLSSPTRSAEEELDDRGACRFGLGVGA